MLSQKYISIRRKEIVIMKKINYDFSNFFRLNYDDIAIANIDDFYAGIIVKKKLFVPKRRNC